VTLSSPGERSIGTALSPSTRKDNPPGLSRPGSPVSRPSQTTASRQASPAERLPLRPSQASSMGCVVRPLPVTDFRSDHPFRANNEMPPSQHRRADAFPVRSAPSSTALSRDDLELARHLASHAPAAAGSPSVRSKQPFETSPPSPDRRQVGPGPPAPPQRASVDREERERSQSYSPVAPQSGAVSSGQVCRYVLPIPSTGVVVP
jgi:hypothetical protein